ncbi:hypothetical protein BK649_01695 [Pseudomonas canadensis]|uniref:Type VI secretion system effector TseH-like domain-containing protein n=1 Tax=Pseudomonas canadensis TaxID=915099 RepID=A0A423FGS0_9PSED|nr:DUF6695 family protein [Pseudomonas canadensis]ROM56923.1 hypothetical protein BK649_01695 [Pseudomonas canadensis]
MAQAAQVTTVATTPAADVAPIQIYLVGDLDYVIPLVFPDYKIHIDDYQITMFGRKIVISGGSAPYLGHAGVLIISGKTGQTKYYEYGRYPGTGPAGRVRVGRIPDVELKGGTITESSLKKTLRDISAKHGQSGNITGVVLRGVVYDKALAWLKAKEAENTKATRQEYDLGNHNCVTFATDLAEAVGFSIPVRTRVVVPTAYMAQFQFSEPDLDYIFAMDTLEITK